MQGERANTRRTFLAAVTTGLVGGCLSGCLFSSDEESETAGSKTGTSTESPSQTAETTTSTTIPPWTEVPTETDRWSDVPALELKNHTETDVNVTLTVDPDDGDPVTDTWVVEPEHNTEVETYEPLDSSATITATVEGYESATIDWAGHEPGEGLVVTVKEDDIELDPVIT